jgi:hypothetical protein
VIWSWSVPFFHIELPFCHSCPYTCTVPLRILVFFFTLGPIAGGFLGETQGWCWVLGLIAITAGVVWIPTTLTTHETYAPYILQSRAKALSKMTGNVYVSRPDAGKPPKTLMQELSVALSRPSVLLFLDTALMATVPTCGLGRVGETAGSVRHSGVGYNCYEGISEGYPSGISMSL